MHLKCDFCSVDYTIQESALKKSKHNFHFCSRKCKDSAQKMNSGSKLVRPSHYIDGKSDYRSSCKEDIEIGCECGENRKFLLFVHHIDGDRKNNNKDNLEVVCSNCHVLRHLKLVDNQWVFDPRSLTPKNELDKLRNIALAQEQAQVSKT